MVKRKRCLKRSERYAISTEVESSALKIHLNMYGMMMLTGETESCSPRWHAVELGLNWTVSITLNDGGRKVGIAICGHDEPKV